LKRASRQSSRAIITAAWKAKIKAAHSRAGAPDAAAGFMPSRRVGDIAHVMAQSLLSHNTLPLGLRRLLLNVVNQ
jgi:hypothetical protein